jgi:AraC family transcriptional regulator
MATASISTTDPAATHGPVIAGLLADALALLDRDNATARQRIEQASRLAGGSGPDPTETGLRGGLAPWQVRKIEVALLEGLHDAIDVAALAAAVRLSPSYFCRAFKASFGATLSHYVIRQRIERAKLMLIAGKEPISQIALACGMTDHSHFTRLFGREVGTTPRTWRRRFSVEPLAGR